MGNLVKMATLINTVLRQLCPRSEDIKKISFTEREKEIAKKFSEEINKMFDSYIKYLGLDVSVNKQNQCKKDKRS